MPTNRARGSSAGADTPPKVVFNVDTAEREGDVPDPFLFIAGGRQIIMKDAAECDWRDLNAAIRSGDDYFFLSIVLEEEDYDHFTKISFPAWKMQQLTSKYRRHYNLPAPEAPGGQLASRR